MVSLQRTTRAGIDYLALCAAFSTPLTVHAYNECTPTPCDLGAVPDARLDSNVTTSALTETIPSEASYVFTDRSKRKPFTMTHTFQKAILRPPHPLPTRARRPGVSPTASP